MVFFLYQIYRKILAWKVCNKMQLWSESSRIMTTKQNFRGSSMIDRSMDEALPEAGKLPSSGTAVPICCRRPVRRSYLFFGFRIRPIKALFTIHQTTVRPLGRSKKTKALIIYYVNLNWNLYCERMLKSMLVVPVYVPVVRVINCCTDGLILQFNFNVANGSRGLDSCQKCGLVAVFLTIT